MIYGLRISGIHVVMPSAILICFVSLNGITENYPPSWSDELHALILEIKREVDSVREHLAFRYVLNELAEPLQKMTGFPVQPITHKKVKKKIFFIESYSQSA